MTQTVGIYIGGVKVAGGTATAGSATIASTTDTANLGGGQFQPGAVGANIKGFTNVDVQVHSESGSLAAGKSHKTRVITDNGTSLVMAHKHPFAD